MSGALLSKLETADTSADRLVHFDELRSSTTDCPDRLGPFLHLIQPAFCDPLRSVRSLAYQCALSYISANPQMTDHFTSAYLAALLHDQADISLHAISLLPEFIVACRCNSMLLIGAAGLAAKRWPTQASAADLARAVAAFRSVDLDETTTAPS